MRGWICVICYYTAPCVSIVEVSNCCTQRIDVLDCAIFSKP